MTDKKIHGIITSGVGGLYSVRISSDTDGKEKDILCRARGVLRREHITPTVGDDVLVMSATSDEIEEIVKAEKFEDDRTKQRAGKQNFRNKGGADVDHVIDEVLLRRNLLVRPPIANLDYLFVVIPCASPAPDLLNVDKLTVIAENYGIKTSVIINKSDLDGKNSEILKKTYELAGYRVFPLSCVTGEGIEELSAYITEISREKRESGHVTGAFAGVSGAGKSTLMSHLFPELSLQTGEVSRKTERGRHTTRKVELFSLKTDGGVLWIADTPGFSVLDFTRFDFFPYSELASSFREFDSCIGNCRYTKCTHLREEGCAVLEKLKNGEIAKSRHESYIRIYEEQRSIPEWKRR